MESVTQKPTIDRVTLGCDQALKIDKFVSTLNQRFGGLLKPSRADIVNFLIDEHESELSENEMLILRTRLYNEVRFISWALVQLRKAKQDGINLTLDDLRAQTETGATLPPRRTRKVKEKSQERTLGAKADNGDLKPTVDQSADVNADEKVSMKIDFSLGKSLDTHEKG